MFKGRKALPSHSIFNFRKTKASLSRDGLSSPCNSLSSILFLFLSFYFKLLLQFHLASLSSTMPWGLQGMRPALPVDLQHLALALAPPCRARKPGPDWGRNTCEQLSFVLVLAPRSDHVF